MKNSLRPALAARVEAARRAQHPETRLPASPANLFGPALALVVTGAWALGFATGFQVSVTILTILGFILVGLGLFSPTPGLLGVGLLATLDAVTRNFVLTGGLLRWNTLNYWLVVVIALNLIFLLRMKDIHTRLLQVFVALLAVELLISSSVMNGIQDILNITAAFGLIVYFARGFQIRGGLYWMAIVSGLTSALGGWVYYQQVNSLPYVNPNSWTFFPLTGIFAICLGYPSAKDHRMGSFIMLLLAGINFLWIFLSGSRGSMLVGFLCLLFLFLWTRQLSWKLAFLGAAWLALGVLSVIYADQITFAADRVAKLFDPNRTLSQRTSGRIDIAEGGLQIFYDNPLGVGTGSFREAIAEDSAAPNQVAAHSGWVKILAENGIPGFVLLLAYVLSFLFVGIRRRSRDLFLLGLLVTGSFTLALLAKEFQGKGLWFFAAGSTVLLHADEMAANLSARSRLAARSQIERVRRWQNGRSS